MRVLFQTVSECLSVLLAISEALLQIPTTIGGCVDGDADRCATH